MATPEEGLASMIANLKEKTGKPLEEWLKIAKSSKLGKHGEIVKHLKTQHGLTHGYANLVAHRFLGSDAGSAERGDDLVDAQYAGAKAGLKPVYAAIMKCVNLFGKDVEASPKKAYVSLRRGKQFAIVQPSTTTRLDLGINLKGVKPTGRLEASGSFNAMVSHRVRLEKAADVDADVKAWLRQAYEAS
jgi:hypothetical protein